MARPTILNHPKFLRLARRVGGEAVALGSLELIWLSVYESGDDIVGDVDAVEAVARWTGARGALCAALVEAGGEGRSGFLDTVDGLPGHYSVHDLDDHAPDYVAKRREREAARRAKGKTLRDVRAEAGRIGGQHTASKRAANGQQTAPLAVQNQANGQQVSSKRPANGAPPAPAPDTEVKDPAAPTSAPATLPGFTSTGTNKPAGKPASKPKREPLPFRAADASRAVAGAARGRYTHTDEITGGHAMAIEKAIRTHPDLSAWERLGAHLAAGGDAFPPDKGPAWLASAARAEAMARALTGAPAANTSATSPGYRHESARAYQPAPVVEDNPIRRTRAWMDAVKVAVARGMGDEEATAYADDIARQATAQGASA